MANDNAKHQASRLQVVSVVAFYMVAALIVSRLPPPRPASSGCCELAKLDGCADRVLVLVPLADGRRVSQESCLPLCLVPMTGEGGLLWGTDGSGKRAARVHPSSRPSSCL